MVHQTIFQQISHLKHSTFHLHHEQPYVTSQAGLSSATTGAGGPFLALRLILSPPSNFLLRLPYHPRVVISFFALSDRLRRISGVLAGNSTSTQLRTNKNNVDQLVSSVVYKEAAGSGKDSGGGGGCECPVCLTAFVDGEVIREVKICKHLFHDSCIEMWLCSHSNCPVCRVFVGVKRSKRPAVVGGGGDEDFRQGLPDSASLV